MRLSAVLLVCGALVTIANGCSHLLESQVVSTFNESLKKHDLEKLQAQSSDDLEQKVVHGEGTFEAIKQAKLPSGQFKILKVVDKKNDDKEVVKKLVMVEVASEGAAKQKLLYVLTHDGDKKSWVVDEMYLSKKDYDKNKSVGAQIAAVGGVQESIKAWKAADRERIMASATPEFADSLRGLSNGHLQRFAKKVTEGVVDNPEVLARQRIGDETAEMPVSRGTDGDLVLKFRQIDGRWKLDDLKVEARRSGESIASARQVVAATSAALAFQEAYRQQNKARLEEVCTYDFFNGSLAAADLASVKLPGDSASEDKFDVTLEGGSATFMIPDGAEMLKISLMLQPTKQLHAAPEYLVHDVTIYELNTSQDKRLSALFTGHATLKAFSAALARSDLKALKSNSTHDLNQRAISGMQLEHLPLLPFAEFEPVEPHIIQTVFKGSLIEVLVEQGKMPLTYLLRDEGGRMLVDDILMPTSARPESVKANVELMLPALNFAMALDKSDMEKVRGTVTRDFSRMIWDHYSKRAPEFTRDPHAHLKAPVTRVKQMGDQALLVFGNERFGSRVMLEREHGTYRVSDVVLVYGVTKDQEISLKRAERRQQASISRQTAER